MSTFPEEQGMHLSISSKTVLFVFETVRSKVVDKSPANIRRNAPAISALIRPTIFFRKATIFLEENFDLHWSN
jgi:hypothetical protein